MRKYNSLFMPQINNINLNIKNLVFVRSKENKNRLVILIGTAYHILISKSL